jgi:hypothetical protein
MAKKTNVWENARTAIPRIDHHSRGSFFKAIVHFPERNPYPGGRWFIDENAVTQSRSWCQHKIAE